jgi:hypothetical protein
MMEISWKDRVRNEEIMRRVQEYRNILHTIKRREVNWIGYILRRNCLLKHFFFSRKIDGRIEVRERRGRRCKQQADDLKNKRRYCTLKEESLDRSVWRIRSEKTVGLL